MENQNNNFANNQSPLSSGGDNQGAPVLQEAKEPKIRFLAGLMVFFAVIGLQLIGNPFLYSHNYFFSIISLAILAFGAMAPVVLSLYLTEALILSGKIKIWNIFIASIESVPLLIVALIIYAFSAGGGQNSDGLWIIAAMGMGITILTFVTFILFVINIVFYKLYNFSFGNKIIYSLFGISIFFSFMMVGLSVRDYNYCDFGKDKECLINKAVSSDDVSLCLKNKYANPHERNNCIITVASVVPDPDICNMIEHGAGRDREEYRSYCLGNIALNINNPSVCESADKDYFKDDCYLIYSLKYGDVNVCSNITENDRWKCVRNVAINSDNSDLCGNDKNCYSDFESKQMHSPTFYSFKKFYKSSFTELPKSSFWPEFNGLNDIAHDSMKFDFRFKYPSRWIISSSGSGEKVAHAVFHDKNIKTFQECDNITCHSVGQVAVLRIGKIPTSLKAKEYNTYKVEKINIDGYQGIKSSGIVKELLGNDGLVYVEDLGKPGDKEFRLMISDLNGNYFEFTMLAESENGEEIFNDIVKTIRFPK